MTENKSITSRELKKISLIISVIGMIILSYSADTYYPEQKNINDIDENIQGQYILICGIVKDLRQAGSNTFIQIKDRNGTIDIVFFEKIDSIEDNSNICIKGVVGIYKGKVEILGKSIA